MALLCGDDTVTRKPHFTHHINSVGHSKDIQTFISHFSLILLGELSIFKYRNLHISLPQPRGLFSHQTNKGLRNIRLNVKDLNLFVFITTRIQIFLIRIRRRRFSRERELRRAALSPLVPPPFLFLSMPQAQCMMVSDHRLHTTSHDAL